jgi:plasmid stability protein
MATLTIRNLDDAVVDRLKAQAKANNRSLEAEARTILEGRVPVIDRKALLERVDRIASMTPKDVEQTDSTLLIREDRDSR